MDVIVSTVLLFVYFGTTIPALLFSFIQLCFTLVFLMIIIDHYCTYNDAGFIILLLWDHISM